ncbi:hypothetical protein JVU11DRAFT_9226 [Chiua virens]|nr:hypothetical protein JVU11DRAFT_9226 [Chiua virens]
MTVESIPSRNNPHVMQDQAEYWVDGSGSLFCFKFPAPVDRTGHYDRIGPYFNLPQTGVGVQFVYGFHFAESYDSQLDVAALQKARDTWASFGPTPHLRRPESLFRTFGIVKVSSSCPESKFKTETTSAEVFIKLAATGPDSMLCTALTSGGTPRGKAAAASGKGKNGRGAAKAKGKAAASTKGKRKADDNEELLVSPHPKRVRWLRMSTGIWSTVMTSNADNWITPFLGEQFIDQSGILAHCAATDQLAVSVEFFMDCHFDARSPIPWDPYGAPTPKKSVRFISHLRAN